MLPIKVETQSQIQRTGRGLLEKYFNEDERAAFRTADAKEWQSFLDTGAIEINLPPEASKAPTERICSRPMRRVLTIQNTEDNGMREAKTRLVTPGDVEPDGEIPVEDGGFRTGAPTCPQFAFHIICSLTVIRRRDMGTLDCKTAFLTGQQHDRDK